MNLKNKIQQMIDLGFTYGQLGKICERHPSSISSWMRGTSNISKRMEESIEIHLKTFTKILNQIWEWITLGFIYKITNDINDKIYIGQTINSIEYRFRSHINETNNSDKQNKFHQALLKLGINHFKVEQIEECPNEQLNEREQYWIQ